MCKKRRREEAVWRTEADQEAEKRRNLENEGKDNEVLLTYDSDALQLKYD